MHALGEAQEAAELAKITPWMRSVIEQLDKNEIVAAIKAIRTNTAMSLFDAKCVADVLRGKSRSAGGSQDRPLADVCVRCLDEFDDEGLFVSIMSLTADGRHQLDDGTIFYDYNRKIADCESTIGEWVSADTVDESESLSRHVVDAVMVADVVEKCEAVMKSIDLNPIFYRDLSAPLSDRAAKLSDVIELQHSLSRSADRVNELEREVDELRSSLATNDNHIVDVEHQHAKAVERENKVRHERDELQEKLSRLEATVLESNRQRDQYKDLFNTAGQFWLNLYPMVEKFEPTGAITTCRPTTRCWKSWGALSGSVTS